MRKKTRLQAIKSVLLAGGFIALLSGCSKEVPEIIKIGDGRKTSASEAGIPLATLADTNLLVYAVAMTGGNDGFPLSPDTKEQIIGIMSSLGYVPVILKDKMVAILKEAEREYNRAK